MAAGGPRHPRKEEAVLGGKLFMGFRTHITHVQQHPSRGHTQDPPAEKGSGESRREWGVCSPLGSLCLVPEGPAPPPVLWPHVLGAPMPLGSPLPPGESCVPGGAQALSSPSWGWGARGCCASPPQPGQNLINTGGGAAVQGGLAWAGTRLRGAWGCPPSGGSGESGGPRGGRSR